MYFLRYMASRIMLTLILVLTFFIFNPTVLAGGSGGAAGGETLSYDFYKQSCPQVEHIVKDGLHFISMDPTSPAALLRLMFHDCQVQGCDASILLDSDNGTSEIISSKNFGIRKKEAIGLLKSMVEEACPQQVSCADILVLAAREAVALSGGPYIAVPLGRRDSSTAPSNKLADASLPPADIGVDGMLRIFADKGMTVEESVAIMGAHTLGVTHCLNILNRLNEGDGVMAPEFEVYLRLNCPILCPLTPNSSFIQNDPTAPFIFNNNYYRNTMRGHGVLKIDAKMSTDSRTVPFVQQFVADQGEFFRAFSSAFVKLSSSGVLTGQQGMIRKSCNTIN